MKLRKSTFLIVTFSLVIASCSFSSDSCEDQEGLVTHSTIEITGVDAVALFKRNSERDGLRAVDENNGTEFSNLVIDVDLAWTEEQHRFRATNTFIYSLLNWFVSPAVACTFPPYYEEFTPAVSNISIHSDTDINENYIAGSDLISLFSVIGVSGENNNLTQTPEDGVFFSAKSYFIEPAYIDGLLVTTPVTPADHVFTVIITLDDGKAFEVRFPEVPLTGV